MTDKYAVVGNPISHSKSPLIHRLFAEQTQQNLIYEALLIDTENTSFQYEVEFLKAQGYQGINITVPFKLDAFEYADELTPRAQIAHAVNTYIFREDGTILGDNTDGEGLVSDIEKNTQKDFANKSILILGAGGAVQGVLEPILSKNPASVHIANRTVKRAEVLGERFKTETPITASGWQEIPHHNFDIIINGTSASLENKVPPVSSQIIGAESLVYDMMYGTEPTVFMDWAKQAQPTCQTRDGLGMLVGQAAEAFYQWRGIRPETSSVIAAVRAVEKS